MTKKNYIKQIIAKIDREQINNQKAELVLSESRLALQSYLDANQVLFSKTLQLASVLYAIILALITILIISQNELWVFPCIAQLLTCMISLYCLYSNIIPGKSANMGFDPYKLLGARKDGKSAYKQSYLNMVLMACQDYQRRIDIEKNNNKKVAGKLSEAIRVLIIGSCFSISLLGFIYALPF